MLANRITYGVFFLLLMTAIEMVQADTCASLREVEEAARTGFKSWQGPVFDTDKERRWFRSTHLLPNTTDCEVFDDGRGERSYHCTWKADSPKAVRRQFDSLATDLTHCFSGNVKTSGGGSDNSEPYLEISNVRGFSKLRIEILTSLGEDPDLELKFYVEP